MKLLLILCLALTLIACTEQKEKEEVFSVNPSDFVVTYLNAMFGNNPSLNKEQGLGIMFLIEDHDSKPVELIANYGYFSEQQKKEADLLKQSVQLFFDDLVKRYGLRGKIILKNKATKVGTNN